MPITKEDILKRVSSHTNGESTTPTGDELAQISDYLEEANQEWAQAYDPQVLVKTFTTTIAVSGTSMALPADFKEKFAGYVSVGGNPTEEFDASESTIAYGDFITWGGNQNVGYYLTVSSPQATTVSVTVPYHSRPTSLATFTSISEIPDPEFLTARTTEKLLLQRGQGEYIEFQQKADLLLQRMVSNEVSADIQRNNTIRTSAEYNNFVIGED